MNPGKNWTPAMQLERQAFWLARLIEKTAQTLEEDAEFEPYALLDLVVEKLMVGYEGRQNEQKSRAPEAK